MAQVYSHLKFMRYRDNLQALEKRQVAAPVHIRIKPINHCNHNCWYCAYRADQLQLGEDMNLKDRIPDDKMREIAADIVTIGVKAVTFSGGGEPLIYKPLPEIIDTLAAGGVKIATLTNGANLQGRMAEAFARHGTWVRISIDAWDDASYAESRGVKLGEFSRVISNIRDFAAAGSKCALGVSFIVTHQNHTHLAQMCALLKDAGAGHVKVSAAVVSNDVAENNRYHRQIMPAVEAQIAQASRLNDSGFQVVNHYHETEERFDKGYHLCPFLQFLTVIGADCKVYTCQDKAYTEKGLLGSIRERSFRDFWFSEENHKRLYQIDPARDCQHHCVTHAKNLALMDYLSIDPEHGAFV